MIRAMYLAACLTAALSSGGCAVYMAANQPAEKNVALLKPGTPRNNLVAEFGPPISTETKNNVRHDIFKFTQGYSTGAKAGRALVHGAADVVTLGLWEVVGTPVEGHFNGTEVSAEVVYDANDQVAQIIPIAGADEINAGTAAAQAAGKKPVETSSIPTQPHQP
jgi:outer membrane protein assembly factor BamE (lipoprotein component of BamABCDE complex)